MIENACERIGLGQTPQSRIDVLIDQHENAKAQHVEHDDGLDQHGDGHRLDVARSHVKQHRAQQQEDPMHAKDPGRQPTSRMVLAVARPHRVCAQQEEHARAHARHHQANAQVRLHHGEVQRQQQPRPDEPAHRKPPHQRTPDMSATPLPA